MSQGANCPNTPILYSTSGFWEICNHLSSGRIRYDLLYFWKQNTKILNKACLPCFEVMYQLKREICISAWQNADMSNSVSELALCCIFS